MAEKKERKILGAKFVKLNIDGDIFLGTLRKREPMVVQGNSTYRYTFENEAGRFAMIGTTQLDDALSDAEMGTLIEITYQGEIQTGNGFVVQQYEVAAIGD